ncbi:CYFA0S38e00144g1_1 [Cyberlindnera fabianii]|uniref:CYFA0S38e00144g1_1 n=1 Tax=Cyberlindnera fabianii TaxID=36022 RepID=A0A061BEL5_CYBFA|nr:CYFA0S38e00144g1_1 [Cyberlindnera fabianii]
MALKHIDSEPENPFCKLVNKQRIAIIPEVELESGDVLTEVPVAYKTWGKLNERGDNCMLICHAFTGSSDVADWWGPLLGPGRSFDPKKFFIVCLNSLGSPYGSASPVTKNPETGERYGPEFPLCTVRDDVKVHKVVLDDLGVKQVAVCIGGSMGGMLTLEWAFLGDYVKTIIVLATSARHSAWCISWSEAQRQSIYSDPKYHDGYYDPSDPPASGLGAARMSALLTYRSRNSFEQRFGRKNPNLIKSLQGKTDPPSLQRTPSTPKEEHWAIHNEGHRGRKHSTPDTNTERSTSQDSLSSTASSTRPRKHHQTYFSAQSYLRYQGQKFIDRFDANCYISISRKLDTHDISRDREGTVESLLSTLHQPALVVGISSDGLFTYTEQETIAEHMPNAVLERIESPEGHDAFLLEFAAINDLIIGFLKGKCPEIMNAPGIEWEEEPVSEVKESVFGEAEDVTNW